MDGHTIYLTWSVHAAMGTSRRICLTEQARAVWFAFFCKSSHASSVRECVRACINVRPPICSFFLFWLKNWPRKRSLLGVCRRRRSRLRRVHAYNHQQNAWWLIGSHGTHVSLSPLAWPLRESVNPHLKPRCVRPTLHAQGDSRWKTWRSAPPFSDFLLEASARTD